MNIARIQLQFRCPPYLVEGHTKLAKKLSVPVNLKFSVRNWLRLPYIQVEHEWLACRYRAAPLTQKKMVANFLLQNTRFASFFNITRGYNFSCFYRVLREKDAMDTSHITDFHDHPFYCYDRRRKLFWWDDRTQLHKNGVKLD
jgi:hypothetical protein